MSSFCGKFLRIFSDAVYFICESDEFQKLSKTLELSNMKRRPIQYSIEIWKSLVFGVWALFDIPPPTYWVCGLSSSSPPPPYSSPKIDFSLGGGIQIKISQSKFLEKSEKLQ